MSRRISRVLQLKVQDLFFFSKEGAQLQMSYKKVQMVHFLKDSAQGGGEGAHAPSASTLIRA